MFLFELTENIFACVSLGGWPGILPTFLNFLQLDGRLLSLSFPGCGFRRKFKSFFIDLNFAMRGSVFWFNFLSPLLSPSPATKIASELQITFFLNVKNRDSLSFTFLVGRLFLILSALYRLRIGQSKLTCGITGGWNIVQCKIFILWTCLIPLLRNLVAAWHWGCKQASFVFWVRARPEPRCPDTYVTAHYMQAAWHRGGGTAQSSW